MKCLETEVLIEYAYRLTDERLAAEVRTHLGECLRCREVVEKHGRLDVLLNDWQVPEPTGAFDARVRQAVDAAHPAGALWGFWSTRWLRGLALASLGFFVVTMVFWFNHSRAHIAPSQQALVRRLTPVQTVQTPMQTANLHPAAPPAHAGKRLVQKAPGAQSEGATLIDKDAQAMEDYDLAANFDLLSELPKSEPRIAN
jgi:hypothetical protein